LYTFDEPKREQNFKTMKTIETFLPLFSGFYSTIWDSEHRISDFLSMENLKYESISFDNSAYDFCEVYADNFITVLHKNLSDLESFEIEELAENTLLQNIDSFSPFGYLEILVKDAQESAKMFGSSWESELCKNAPLEVLGFFKVEMADFDLMPVIK